MGRQAMIEFNGSHFEREVILSRECRVLGYSFAARDVRS
jgi:hypothetical protein